MSKKIFFDTGPIISLTMNNLLWILEPLKKSYGGDFLITPAVRKELIEQPLATHKYKFEALQVLPYINKSVLTLLSDPTLNQKTLELLTLFNTSFQAKGSWITIVQYAEIETLAAALTYGSDAVVLDERTTRYLIEKPQAVQQRLQKKLHMRVDVNKANLRLAAEKLKNLRAIRSAELVTRAFELGLLDKYIENKNQIAAPRRAVLEGVLWAVKLNGCAITEEDIESILRIESV